MKDKFVIYAHRGASEYYPENTLSSFFAGLEMGADGIETDVQKTKDGVLVLFHDDTLARVTGEPGKIADYTLCELRRFLVKNEKYGRADRIVTFDEFLSHFAFRDLTFAVEIKVRGIASEVIEKLKEYGAYEKTVVTSFLYDELVAAREYDPAVRLGWLYSEEAKDLFPGLLKIRAEQACPKAETLTKEGLSALYAEGYDVRAWGIFNEEIMKNAVLIGVNAGMTVNFPDKLVEYRKTKK